MRNYDAKTVNNFGEEWAKFSQDLLSEEELNRNFESYFNILDWEEISRESQCFDMGCGSGRWAKLVAPRVGTLHCVDASEKALEVAKKNLHQFNNCHFSCASVDDLPFEDNSMDFGYSLGVLHHIPDTLLGIQSCVDKIKPGGIFLAYIYYAFDNKPMWFWVIWKISDLIRLGISGLPFKVKVFITSIVACVVYYPLARLSLVLENLGIEIKNVPLSFYRNMSFYSMRTDTLDRFGTRMEKRFTKKEITEMFESAGLDSIVFSDVMPYWCVIGYKKKAAS